MKNFHFSPNERDVAHKQHAEHLLDMIQIELFNKFKESHCDIDIPINIFVKIKSWNVRPITMCDTLFSLHVEF
jgi:hypothetical protein